MKPEKMSNAMLIEYLYEEIEDLNDFLSSLEIEGLTIETWLWQLERIVEAHQALKGEE